MDEIENFDFDLIIMDIKNGRYRSIGSGSGRQVFDLENGFVLKAAKNRKGIAQNEAEFHIASADFSNLFAKIPHVSSDLTLLIMEKADRINDFSDVWKYYKVNSNRELFNLEEINYIFSKYNLVILDLYRRTSWGLINNRPVIIDYGLTWEVKKKYYLPF